MRINMPYRYRWLLRHCAIDLLIFVPLGLVGEIVCKLVFPPHTISWKAEGIDALMTAFWLTVIWLCSMLLPPNAAHSGVDPKANPWKQTSEGWALALRLAAAAGAAARQPHLTVVQ